ncbi:lactonase family protein [Ralstonia pseudosolanacearum]|uniref:lactonase family protein n=1 Tax=Ralstonia pseudosolanacearum TaxID=1310165 RepID=UPI0002C0F289|nr:MULTISPECIES: lactonase family protein [Ralstonia]ANH34995.1 hemagglutinin-related protein [Ralstonia solanacearum]AGH86138.1 6-phosphogluconolactonase [Ralstonia pseudosolanacearum FQY_4]MDO3516546.1 lactonase family protein [Ralstonia pseudosolanacearum]MDO3542798.1 lactonase family protein [Ralstonia pseudosolanacearum]UZF38294.1 lactonase family protein [Ralstonia sp. RS647]
MTPASAVPAHPCPPGPSPSRRRLLQAALSTGVLASIGTAAPAAASAHATSTPSKPMDLYAYVGSRTTRERNARGDGISVFRVDTQTGGLAPVQLVKDLVNPSFLALNAAGDRLYTVHGDLADISAFAVDRASGRLSFINRQSTQGKNPVHLALDPSGRFVVVTNHIGASLAVLPLAADGALGEVTQLVKLDGPIGPHRIEQKQAKPHFNRFDPAGRFVIVPDKGLDRTFAFRFAEGRLTPAAPSFVSAREGAGPRHVAFRPDGRFAYVVNELDSTVTTYGYDAGTATLTPLQVLPSLPDTFTGNSRASEIEVDAAGRFVYASNRGHDSIAVFRIDAASGLLRFVATEPSLGRTPRFFTIDPGGRFLYALNEDSDSIVAFAIDPHTGRLHPTGTRAQSGSPVCMVFSTPAA